MNDPSASPVSAEPSQCCACGRACGPKRPQFRGLGPGLAAFIRERSGAASLAPEGRICRECLAQGRVEYVLARLAADRGVLNALEADVARKAANHSTIALQLEKEFSRGSTRGQRLADAVARVGGSWPFVLGFLVLLGLWMAANSLLSGRGFDPYPYIFLNLLLSCVAALQAPIIMMSQNRSAARDRLQADQDFRINLKAEIEVAALHEKVDHLLHAQWESLIEVQEMQIDLLQELLNKRSRRPHGS